MWMLNELSSAYGDPEQKIAAYFLQWPTLLEALATRSADDTPHLTITTVVPPALQRVMREIGQRMEKFARLMGVPFRFSAVHLPLAAGGWRSSTSTPSTSAATAPSSPSTASARCAGLPASRRRDAFLAAIRRLEPRIVTVESFPKTSNERLALERAAGRAVVDLVACPAEESAERRERAAAWSRRLRAAGFAPAAFSDDVADDVRSLLRRYREGWSMKDAAADDAGIFLAWKDQPVVWASAWRP
ncbi:Protein SHORT-ROOT 1 [Ananas comosus]|uniref:Protein SHORT-ROOT 1 n=1 Tax=Ananas comosus TaxID=4615 RepID=A0A199UKM1_ANACO|nr:Protein SHORT-ROOT 1 [Ananas comosus]